MSTIQQLQNKIEKLEDENELLKKKLFTYTNPEAKRKYYKANKELVKAKALINEYKSSITCHRCYNELEKWQGKHRIQVCHRCSGSESKKSVFVDRDMNACHNLITISKDWLENKFRRLAFSREKSDNDLTLLG